VLFLNFSLKKAKIGQKNRFSKTACAEERWGGEQCRKTEPVCLATISPPLSTGTRSADGLPTAVRGYGDAIVAPPSKPGVQDFVFFPWAEGIDFPSCLVSTSALARRASSPSPRLSTRYKLAPLARITVPSFAGCRLPAPTFSRASPS
jgi:hypothetical protein